MIKTESILIKQQKLFGELIINWIRFDP